VWLLIIGGTLYGIFMGAMPGLSVTLALALILPFTFWLPVEEAIILLIIVYNSSVYGGSISAVLLKIPGTAASIVTTFDGYPMAQAGRAGLALGISALASAFGAIAAAAILLWLGPTYVNVAIKFGPSAIFMVALWGFVLSIIVITGGKLINNIIIGCIGILLSFIGTEPFYGIARFTFGINYIFNGIPTISAVVGLFGVSTILQDIFESKDLRLRVTQQIPKLSGFKEMLSPGSLLIMLVSTVIGFTIGVIPGTGAIVATLLAYGIFSRFSKNRDNYGKGCPEGVLIAETGNNAVNPGATLTTLVLGVPGSVETVVLLGAFIIHGLRCGPLLLVQRPDFLYIIFESFIVSAFVTLGIAWLTMRIWTKAIEAPKSYLWPVIFLMCMVGVYSINNNMSDVAMMLIIGVFGFFAEMGGFSIVPLVMGLVLGPIMEESLRTVLGIGSPLQMFTRPIPLTLFLMLIVVMVVFEKFLKKPKL
jgi:putative tricarboxylic transport membrane protein